MSSWEQVGSNIIGTKHSDLIGYSVSMNGDGTRFVSGGYTSGVVKVYEYSGGSWSQLGSNISIGSSNRFGYSVDIDNTGNTIVIGEPGQSDWGDYGGKAYIYEYSSGSWSLSATIDGSEGSRTTFGQEVSINNDGTIVAIGSPYYNGSGTDRGIVKIYEYSSGSWSQKGNDIVGGGNNYRLGWSLSTSNDGLTIGIGMTGYESWKGGVRVYEWDSGSSDWSQKGDDIEGDSNNDQLSYSVSLNGDGTRFVVGAINDDNNGSNSGSVEVYEWDSGTSSWSQMGSTISGDAAGDKLGHSVDINDDGTIIVMGAPHANSNDGVAKIYEYSDSSWSQKGSDIDPSSSSSGEMCGWHVSINDDGDKIAVSGPYYDETYVNNGLLRFYEYSSGGSSVPCFCAGTLIKTEKGDIPVEELKEGDEIITNNNMVLKIMYNAKYKAKGKINMPIKITKDAFGESQPSKDLYISPNHRIPSNEGTKQAKEYVNGTTITQRKDINEVIYYNIYTEPTTNDIYANDLEVNVDNLNLRGIQHYREKEINPKKLKVNYNINVNDVFKSLLKTSN